VQTASIKAAVTVGINVPLTSGKEIGITNASWNVCKVKKDDVFILGWEYEEVVLA
jgi:Na+/H+ antiporter NhaA